MNLTNNKPNKKLHLLPILSIFFLLCKHGSAGANLSNQTDQLALLDLKHQISNDPHNFFDSWNDSLHFCQWQGVTCGLRHQRVVGLNLSGQNIQGTITPHIGNLSFLSFLNLLHNRFHGEIPQQIGRLFRLKYLLLSNNTLSGQLSVNFSSFSNLRVLGLAMNRLMGPIPVELNSLKMLDILTLAVNNFTGVIPRSFGNLTSLTQFSIQDNKIEGTIPSELGQLTNMTYMSFSVNNLTGMIPFSLFNISTISTLGVAANNLTGALPLNIGLTLPNLQEFYSGANNFHGEIPRSFSNASQLQILEISVNSFTGQVPASLGYLQNLLYLDIGNNLLGSSSINDLSFITSLSNISSLQSLYLDRNNFGGEIPISIGNFSTEFQVLALGYNRVAGIIPSVFKNLRNLYSLGLQNNLMSGTIPTSLGRLGNLQELLLDGNKLSGRIPSQLGNITLIYKLDLSDNKLDGIIPVSLGNCEKLNLLDLSKNSLNGSIPKKVFSIFSLSIYLNLSQNSLTGPIPVEVGTLKNLNALDISNNKLTGTIPGTIGECSSLEYLYVQGNFFQGIIPSGITVLRGVRELDLSSNNLSGKIPTDIEKLPYLHHLNLSFNMLEGELPKIGVFGNVSTISVTGNIKLCGGITQLELPPCQIKQNKKTVPLAWKIVIIASCCVSVFVIIIIFIFVKRKTKKLPVSADSIVERLLKVSYHDLYRATEGFSSRCLIGSGGFGSVYQGKLNPQEDNSVAVKVLNLEKSGASKSFIAECRALKNIRHRNLVKIITYCSSIDSNRNQFKALVYEFMSNGSLDLWLHPPIQESSRSLSLLERLNIAIDAANAIQYLHDHCEPPIIHCDLKPSNILLDNDLIAHVGDFGLAMILSESADMFVQSLSSSIGIKGSVGYAAPEYGMGGEASKYGDVYSYGVLLLEMLTGRRPTDDMFKDGLILHNYVWTALEQEDVMMIVDPTLLKTGESDTGTAAAEEESEYGDNIMDDQHDRNRRSLLSGRDEIEKCIVGVLDIGVRCSVKSAKDRMGMNEVLRELHHIRTAFHGAIIENRGRGPL